MRRLRLRTQLSLVVVFLTIYSLAVLISYRIQARAQSDLETAFQNDLAVLTRLPRLDDELRHLELLTDQYLLTGNPAWLHERRRVAADISRLEGDLTRLLAGHREYPLWLSMDGDLSRYLAQQELWIGRKSSGRLTVANAVHVEGQTRRFDHVLAAIARMRDQSVQELQQRRRAARRASRLTFDLTVMTGLLVGCLLALFVSWYVIEPINALERYASEWQLGADWSLRPPASGPELENLYKCLAEMSRRLNSQYAKEQELAQFKSQLVSLVSHEFNNALSIINGVSLLLEETEAAGGDDKRAHFYAVLKSNVRALHVAANNLLNMGRLESGKFAITPRRVALEELARQCYQRLEILAIRKKLAVDIVCGPASTWVRADPDALSLAITNLLSNAIKYTPEGGRIRVVIGPDEAQPGRAVLSIEDSGIGIKPEDQERVFSGYYRTEKGKATAKGFGVGLPLARRIVEAHESQICVESEPGRGSRFSFSLPLEPAAAS